MYIQNYFKGNKYIKLDIPINIDWRNELDIQKRIIKFDIGIATLIDNEIQKSKSGIKAKQYLNNGIPVLGTKLPENDWVIKDGINGYFCKTDKDFKKRIIEFYTMDNDLYNRFSMNAKDSISEFNHEKYYNDLKKIKTLH